MTTARLMPSQPKSQPAAPQPRRLQGWLPDGTPHHAPVGLLLEDGDRVCCHLCGRWFLSVASHLRVHDWTRAGYLVAFGLEWTNPLSGQATHERRSAALSVRQIAEPAIRNAQSSARDRARSGALATAAATAARGRPHPPQRRAKTLAALAVVNPQNRAAAIVDRARRDRDELAAAIASRFGFPTFADYATDRLKRGLSMAAISREAGLHKDWMNRHLEVLAPEVARRRTELQPDPRRRRWQVALAPLGFTEAAEYLRVRHVVERQTVSAIAQELGLSRAAVSAELHRVGIVAAPHVASRRLAAERDRLSARRLGFDGLADYVAARRETGATWRKMVAEVGVPETSLRRLAGAHT